MSTDAPVSPSKPAHRIVILENIAEAGEFRRLIPESSPNVAENSAWIHSATMGSDLRRVFDIPSGYELWYSWDASPAALKAIELYQKDAGRVVIVGKDEEIVADMRVRSKS